MRCAILAVVCGAAICPAAEIPNSPLATKGEPLLSDDFTRSDPGPWGSGIPTFSIVDGVLKGSQTRDDHGAVGGVKVAYQDAIIEFSFRFAGAQNFSAVFDDKAHKDSHAGHICRVSVMPTQVRLGDDKEGAMRNDIFEMRKDPQRKAEADKLIVGRSAAFPVALDPHRWYRMTIEIVGDEMRVCLDDKAVGYLKSSGIAHATKSDFRFSVNGQDVLFDDVGIWKALGPEEEGFRPLFDGQSFEGWKVTSSTPRSWKVEEGLLVLTGGNSHLLTKEEFGDFVVRFQWRPTKPGYNSGFFVRGRQIQMAQRSAGLLMSSRGTKAVPELHNPPGEWNDWEITCIGPRLALKVNGKPAWEIDNFPPGCRPLGFEAEGREMAVRNILIKTEAK